MSVKPSELQGARLLDRQRQEQATVQNVITRTKSVDADVVLYYENSDAVEHVHYLAVALNPRERFDRVD